jgi:D-sedoheptulose 7-phosphate isomerase
VPRRWRAPRVTETARFAAMMEGGAALRRWVAAECAGAALGVVDACDQSLRAGGRLFFCGNGVRVADAQRLATGLLVRLRSIVERPS